MTVVDISDVQILGSDRQQVEVEESWDSSIGLNSTCSVTVAKSLLECLQTPKCSELSRKRREF